MKEDEVLVVRKRVKEEGMEWGQGKCQQRGLTKDQRKEKEKERKDATDKWEVPNVINKQ